MFSEVAGEESPQNSTRTTPSRANPAFNNLQRNSNSSSIIPPPIRTSPATPRETKFEEEEIELTEEELEQLKKEAEEEERPEQLSKREKAPKWLPQTNEQIPFQTINYITGGGKLHSNVSLREILRSYSKRTHVLVLCNPSTRTCRLFSKGEYNRHLRQMIKLTTTRTQEFGENKEMQLTWNIGENDLLYRLRKAIKYLNNGQRLSIIIGARKSKLVRDKDGRVKMLQQIRDTLKPYGTEWREMTGGFPSANLWFRPYTEPEKKRLGLMDTEEQHTVSSKLIGGDSQYISSEDYMVGRMKFRGKGARKALRQEAEAAFQKAMGETQVEESEGKMTPQKYWEQLGEPRSESSKSSDESTEKSSEEVGPEKDPAEILAELDQSDPATLQNQEETQEKIRSVAAQFSKLGGQKSLFGGKLGGR